MTVQKFSTALHLACYNGNLDHQHVLTIPTPLYTAIYDNVLWV